MTVIFMDGAAIILLILILLCVVRAVKGPSVADRIVSVNVGTTITAAIIGILSMRSGEGFFTDVGLIYVILSFMAVIVLVRFFLAGNRNKKDKDGGADA